MEIKFTRRPTDVFQRLVSERPRLLRSQAEELLRTAFKHNAYVAGGFARVVTSAEGAPNDEKRQDRLWRYLEQHDPIDRSNRWWKVGRGDIDLFFQNHADLAKFEHEVSRFPVFEKNRYPSPSGSCIEFDCDKCVCVQVVTRYVAPIEEQLKSFDIYNAMVAFNDKEMIMPHDWKDYEDSNTLHVVGWRSPFTVQRMRKWFWKHRYDKLSQETASELGIRALDIIARLKAQPLTTPFGEYKHDKVVYALKEFVPHMTNDELLMLTSLYPEDSYGFMTPFKILCDRGGLPSLDK